MILVQHSGYILPTILLGLANRLSVSTRREAKGDNLSQTNPKGGYDYCRNGNQE